MSTPRVLDARSRWRFSQEEERLTDERSLEDSAKLEWGRWVSTLRKWDLFATLTYDPLKVNGTPEESRGELARVNEFRSERHVTNWLQRVENVIDRPVDAIMVMERHESGQPHWHGLLSMGGLAFGDIRQMSTLWFDKHGFARLEVPRDRSLGDREMAALRERGIDESALPVAQYCAKYLIKRVSLVILHLDVDRGVQELLAGFSHRFDDEL